jgi:hypothetical protein
MQQLKADCALLEACRIMDYSLLLGVHYRSTEAQDASRRLSSDGTAANFEEHDGASDLEAEVEKVQVGGQGVGGEVGGQVWHV